MKRKRQILGAMLSGLFLLAITSLPQPLRSQAKIIEIHYDKDGEISHISKAKAPKSVVVERSAGIPKPGSEPRTISGDSVSQVVRQHPGQVTMIMVWASWCPSCHSSMPAVSRVAGKYRKKGLSVVTFSVDENQKKFERNAKKFRGEVALYRIRPDGQDNIGREMAELGVVLDADYQGEIPLFVFLDKKGEHIVSFAGGPSYKDLNTIVDFILTGSAKSTSSVSKIRKKNRRR